MDRFTKLSKYSEIIIGCLISIVLLGAVICLIEDYTNRLKAIEHIMQKIGGPNWNTPNHDFPNIEALHSQVVCLDRQKFKALLAWAKVIDKNFIDKYSKSLVGYAHITDRLDNKQAQVLLNISNLNGECLDIGDKIEIVNIESPLNEKVNVVVCSIYSDLQHTDVIVQVNHKVANLINFDPKRGKLKVKLNRVLNEDNKWYSLDERLNLIMKNGNR